MASLLDIFKKNVSNATTKASSLISPFIQRAQTLPQQVKALPVLYKQQMAKPLPPPPPPLIPKKIQQQVVKKVAPVVQKTGQILQKFPSVLPKNRPYASGFTEAVVEYGVGDTIRSAGRTIERASKGQFGKGNLGNKLEDYGNLAQVMPFGGIFGKTSKLEKYFPKAKSALESKTIQHVVNNFPEVKNNYLNRVIQRFGNTNVVSADEAKHVIPGFNGMNASDYHEASSGFAKALYNEMLQAKKKIGNNTVMFMSGGTGSGKTTALRVANIDTKAYPIIYDTNLSGLDSSTKKITDALDSGYNVEVNYVQRHPVTAFTEGVLPRVRTEGRVVSIPEHIERHDQAFSTLQKLKQKFGDRININYIDNTGERQSAHVTTLDNLPKYNYNSSELKGVLNERLNQAVQAGKITEQEAQAIRGTSFKDSGSLSSRSKEFRDASEHINSHINPDSSPNFFQKGKQAISNFTSEFKTKFVDKFAPIEDTINKIEKKYSLSIPKTQDPRMLYNRVLGSTSIATQALKQNLAPVLKTVGNKNIDEFDRYLAARHALDVGQRGIKTGLDLTKAKTYVDALAPKYEQQAQQITQYTQKILKFAADNGLIASENYQKLIDKYPNYVPLQRVFDELENAVKSPISPSIASVNRQTIVRRLKGSEREIQSPLNSIFQKTFEAFDQVERNRLGQALVNLRLYPGFEEIIKKIKPDMALVAREGEKDIFRPSMFPPKNKNVIEVFENGVKKYYEVPKEIADTAKGLNAEQLGLIGKILSYPSRVFRATTTSANLPFATYNLIRDQLTAFLNSNGAGVRNTILHPGNFVESFFDAIGEGGEFKNYLSSGGGGTNFLAQGKNQYKATISDLAKGKGAKIFSTVTNPTKWLSTLEDAISTAENLTRTQQFRATRQGLKSKGIVNPFDMPTADILDALKAGRETTVDFGKMGTWGKVLNSAFVYLNAGIQGTRTVTNAFKKNPLGTTFKTVAALYLPVAMTTAWNTATPDRKKAFEDIPAWEKNNSIIILPPNPVKDSKGNYIGAIKIPMPQTYSALTIPIREAITYLANANPQKIQDTLLQTLGGYSPVDFSSAGALMSRAVPTALQPVIENYTNKKLFTGQDIVPRDQQQLSPEMQVGNKPSFTITEIGKKLGIAPAHLQNLVAGYGGAVSMQVLNAIDTALNKAGVAPDDQIGGENVAENLFRRFMSVKGGNTENTSYAEMDRFAQQAKDRLYTEKKNAEDIYTKLKEAPQEQRQQLFDDALKNGKITENNIDTILKMFDEEQAKITGSDKYLKSISPPERASYITKKIQQMPTNEEKAKYIEGLVTKGILTDETIDEIINSATAPEETSTPKVQSWNQFQDIATQIADAEGFPSSVLLGQAAVETGRSPSKAPKNNWFGIKGSGSGGSSTQNTKEAIGGVLSPTTGTFAGYQTVEDSIHAYISWVKENVPDYEDIKENPTLLIKRIKQAGYATDPNYLAKVTGTPEFNSY